MDNTARKDIAVVVSDITKTFHLPHESHSGVKQLIINLFRKNKKKGYETQQVLNGVSFEIKKGEFFGIVGRNGSGKSTLLKLLAGIYTPDTGTIQTNGSIVPFIELGVGFNPELTGRENVFLNGALLGFSRDEMKSMYGDIVEFAELEQFMDQKLKNYSSGMQVRLAFSIAIRAKGDTLLLDEVLAVGDEAFQKKCYDYFSQLRREGKTVILVTHDMSAVQRFCSRAMLIDKGTVKDIGNSQRISTEYSEMFSSKRSHQQSEQNKNKLREAISPDDAVSISEVSVLQDGQKKVTIKAKQDFSLRIALKSKKTINKTTLGINLINSQGNIMLAASTKGAKDTISVRKGLTVLTFNIQNVYTDDTYSVNIALVDDANSGEIIFQKPDIYRFEISGIKLSKHSLTHPNIGLEVGYEPEE